MRRAALVPLALAAWTAFIWGTRVRNILRDDGPLLSLVLALGMLALAVAVVVSVARAGRPAWAVPALAGATVVTWAVRTPLILLADHGVGFTVVHTALAVASVALAWRAVAPARGRGVALARR